MSKNPKIIVPEDYKLNENIIKNLHEKENYPIMIVALSVRFDLTDYSKDQIDLIAKTNNVKATMYHELSDTIAIYSFKGTVKGVTTCLKEIFSLDSDIELFYLVNEKSVGKESVNNIKMPDFLVKLRELCLIGEVAEKLEQDFQEYIKEKLK